MDLLESEICDWDNCQEPVHIVAFATEVDGSYCLKHLDKKMIEAGVIEGESEC